LQFIVRNDGSGLARNLFIRAGGKRFEGQLARTQQIMSLRAGHERRNWLDVRPLEYGESVPLRLSVEYEDESGSVHSESQTIYIRVSEHESEQDEGSKFELTMAPSAEASRLKDILSRRLNPNELRDLSFDLGVNYHDLGGEGHSANARRLVRFLQQREALPRLVEWLRSHRPDVDIEDQEE
jgi:hypothetical protein